MSYLEMEKAPLPDMMSGVISFWFKTQAFTQTEKAFEASWYPVELGYTLGPNQAAFLGGSYLMQYPQLTQPHVWTYPFPGPEFGGRTPPTYKNKTQPLLCFGDTKQKFNRVYWEMKPLEGPPVWIYLRGGVPQTIVSHQPTVKDSVEDIVPPSFIGICNDGLSGAFGQLRIVLQTKDRAQYKGYAWAQVKTERIHILSPLTHQDFFGEGGGLFSAKTYGYADLAARIGLSEPNPQNGYNLHYEDVSMLEATQHPEAFIMDTGVRVNDGKWHHVVISFSLSGAADGGAATAPTNTGGALGAAPPPPSGTAVTGNADSSNAGAVFAQATGPPGTPPYPGTWGQYSGPKGEFEFGGITNPGRPYEEVGKYGPANGGEIKSACRAWVAIDGKTLKGKALNHHGAWTQLQGMGGQALLDALHPHAIIPPNAFLAPFREVRGQMDTNLTQWERDYRSLLGAATGPAAQIEVTHEKRQQDHDRPAYDYTPTALPTFGNPVSIPAGVGFGPANDWNEETEMAELQIWANKTIDLDNPKNILLFITKDGEPEVNFKAVEKLLGKPHIRLHGSGNWKNGNNTGSLGYKITGSGRTRKKKKIPEGQFKFKGKIDRKLPDPEIKDYKPPGTT